MLISTIMMKKILFTILLNSNFAKNQVWYKLNFDEKVCVAVGTSANEFTGAEAMEKVSFLFLEKNETGELN